MLFREPRGWMVMAMSTSRPPRYIAMAITASWDADDYPTGGQTSIETTDADHRPQWSGLLDAHGVRLYRVLERVPVGFHGKGLRA
jgi:hypothetical protein